LESGVLDGAAAEYALFLARPGAAGEAQGFSVFAFTPRSERLLTGLGLDRDDWPAKYEANTAYGWWLRRRADGTGALWHDALTRLLSSYDPAWLAARGG
jgi:hypothetical protein